MLIFDVFFGATVKLPMISDTMTGPRNSHRLHLWGLFSKIDTKNKHPLVIAKNKHSLSSMYLARPLSTYNISNFQNTKNRQPISHNFFGHDAAVCSKSKNVFWSLELKEAT